jgi:ubiquinol-cytochrome c reductase cytochrome b subunit
LLALIGLHLTLIVYHKHTQWPGPGRRERNVVGYPFLPVYLSKSTGFFFMVFGVIALMGGLFSINPVWKYGPYDPSKVSAGAQPDWYMGIAEGLLRIMPGWETHVWGHTISWNVMLPGEVLSLGPFVLVIMWPFVEAWVTGDRSEHHLLQRPRNVPTRTAFLASMIALYGLLWAAGGNDIMATHLHLSLNSITYFMRGAVFVIPTLVFHVTRRWCIGLQRADSERLLHGRETGIITRSPEGGYREQHLPLSPTRSYTLATRPQDEVYVAGPRTDENGVPAPSARADRVRARLSQTLYADNVPTPTAEELEEAQAPDQIGPTPPEKGGIRSAQQETSSGSASTR